MNKPRGALPLILVFCVLLALFPILLLATPDRDYSPNENRYLASLPRFTLKSYFRGDFAEDFEDYLTDQFPFRDRWLDVKSRTERLIGKTENNSVFFCSQDTLITRFRQPSDSALRSAALAVRTLDENTDAPVVLALIPTAAEVWRGRLPANADTADQLRLIAELEEACGVPSADVAGALTAHADEPVFYRTDHHWTSLGACYGMAAVAEALGTRPPVPADYRPVTVTDSFYGTVYSSSGVRWVAPDSMESWVPADGVTVTRYEGSQGEQIPLYAEEYLSVKDCYSYFFGGNTPRLVISTGNPGGRLLVIRDSYADSGIPFLFGSWSEIHMLDLRYYRQSISDYAAENGFDAILVLYGLNNFVTDLSVSLMGT